MAEGHRPDPDAEDVAVALQVGLRLLLRELRQAGDGGDLTAPQTSALARLDRDGPATANELARAEQISPQSMGATVAVLAERGLIERHADPEDGRRLVLEVSRRGRNILRARRGERTRRLAKALAGEFTTEELVTLEAAGPLLERLAARF